MTDSQIQKFEEKILDLYLILYPFKQFNRNRNVFHLGELAIVLMVWKFE